MKLLITGIHGFVGGNLVEALKKNHTIYGLDIINPSKEGVRYTFSWSYLDKEGGVPEIDAIIHLAGKAHDTKRQSAEEEYFRINRDLTIRIFEFFRDHKNIKKFVFFSTAKAAADQVAGILTEDVEPSPTGPYGQSKIAAEQYILDAIKKTPEDFFGRNIYVFRPCMIHGPGNKGNLNLLYNVVRKGFPWPLGAYENRRTFTSIENVCFAVSGVLTKDIDSGIYNLGDDEALSTNELIEEICKSLGKKAHIWNLPKGMINSIARVGGWLHLPLTPDRLRKLTESYIASNAKIKRVLGVERMPVDARDGLRVTLESFKKG